MKRVVLGLLFVLLFCGNVYSQNWSGEYELITTDQGWDEGSITIKKNGSNYKVSLELSQIMGRGDTEGFCFGDNIGKTSGDSLLLYDDEGKQIIFKLVQNGKNYNIIPQYNNGDIVPWCGKSSGTIDDPNGFGRKTIQELKWKKVK